MLVLSRKLGQAILIGDGENAATVTVVGIVGQNVRLGVEAHESVSVDRLEVRMAKQANVPPVPKDPPPAKGRKPHKR